jgi:hypothetical protein
MDKINIKGEKILKAISCTMCMDEPEIIDEVFDGHTFYTIMCRHCGLEVRDYFDLQTCMENWNNMNLAGVYKLIIEKQKKKIEELEGKK